LGKASSLVLLLAGGALATWRGLSRSGRLGDGRELRRAQQLSRTHRIPIADISCGGEAFADGGLS
jgi:hypothetical protein